MHDMTMYDHGMPMSHMFMFQLVMLHDTCHVPMLHDMSHVTSYCSRYMCIQVADQGLEGQGYRCP